MTLADNAPLRRVWCKPCRAVMLAVTKAAPKTCVFCRADLTHAKRVKDVAGNYYCPACWEADAQRDGNSLVVDDSRITPADAYPCYVCHFMFTVDEVYAEPDGDTICKSCWAEQARRRSQAIPDAPGDLELSSAPNANFGGAGTSTQTAGLPADLELLPPEADDAPARDSVFCEECNRVYPPDQLDFGTDGSVVCKGCAKRRRTAAVSEISWRD